jgi:divalent metal cation (Fe/Co/Zn/Cd) transporter
MRADATAWETRAAELRRGRRLEYLTVSWNIAEGLVAVAAASAAGSIALLGFGVDSFIESASAGVMIWRLASERRPSNPASLERLERRARRMIAASLVLLALYVAWDAGWALARHEAARSSGVGLALLVASLGVMLWLASAKRRVARALGSRALAADAFQSTACWWLSLLALSGLALNAALGWWWADPLAALAMTVFLGREAHESWRGDPCG